MIDDANAAINVLRDLESVAEGSASLDAELARVAFPGRRVVVSGGEPFWEMVVEGVRQSIPVPRYTRSLDARLPGEDIARVERIMDRATARWRAWMANDWFAEGRTEAIARRLAALTHRRFEANNDRTQLRKLNAHLRPSPAQRRRQEAQSVRPPEAGVDATCGVRVDPGGEPNHSLIIEVLCEHIRRLKLAAAPIDDEELPIDNAANGRALVVALRHPRFEPTAARHSGRSGALLSEGLAAWERDARPRVKNLERVSRAVRRFIELFGDRPMDSYTRSEVRKFIHEVQRVPRWPPIEIRYLPLPIILKYADENPSVERITPRTAASYLKDLQLVFNWAMSCEMCTNNPANNLRVIDRRPQSELRVAFDLEDLKLIFERSPMYAGCESAHRRARPGKFIVKDSVFWFPLAALYTGARLGELATAMVDDFKEEGGIAYLDIHAGRDNRHLKTKSSDRRVPIHPELVGMGFLAFVAERCAKGRAKVFEDVQGRRAIRTIHGWSQTWQIYQDHLGIRDRRKVFYSFRHNFKRACRDAGIDEEVHDCLTGHRPYWGGRRYGEGISLDVLAKAMARVEYRGLDLSHLYVRKGRTSKKGGKRC